MKHIVANRISNQQEFGRKFPQIQMIILNALSNSFLAISVPFHYALKKKWETFLVLFLGQYRILQVVDQSRRTG